MLSINPQLQPEQLRMLLRRSAMTVGDQHDFERSDAQDLTAPILPSERNYRLDDKDVGRSAKGPGPGGAEPRAGALTRTIVQARVAIASIVWSSYKRSEAS